MFVILVATALKTGPACSRFPTSTCSFPRPSARARCSTTGCFASWGASLLLGLFLLFQYGWLHSLYGIGVGMLLFIVALYGVSVFLAQVVAMAAYSQTSSSPRRRALAKGLIYGVLGAFAAAVLARAALSRAACRFPRWWTRPIRPVPPHARGRVDGGDAARGDDGRLYHACPPTRR